MNISDKLAEALRECAEYMAAHLEEGRDHRVIVAADAALAAYDAADRLTNAGDWQVEPVTLTISGRARKGRNYREPLAYVPSEILNRELIAPRIVACVNACAGIPTCALETMPLDQAAKGVWQ